MSPTVHIAQEASESYQDHLGDDNLQLSTQTISMLCYQNEDKGRVQDVTVKMGKDNSPSSLMDHLRIHHGGEHT
jgi:hypothetical protein